MDVEKKILVTASALFAENRYDSVSLRNVAKAADISLSAISYYFDNKQDLYVYTARYIFRPMHRHRRRVLEMLDESSSREEVIRAYIESICQIFLHPKGRVSAHFLWRFSYESDELCHLVLNELFTSESMRFRELFRGFHPHLQDGEHFWIMQLFNAMIFVTLGELIGHNSAKKFAWATNKQEVVNRLVDSSLALFDVQESLMNP